MKNQKLAALKSLFVAITICSFAIQNSLASPFYIETFRHCQQDESGLDKASDLTGWKAFRSNSSIGKVGFLKINSPGAPDSPRALNSFSAGRTDGSLFWSKSAKGLTIFTEEFLFDVSALSFVQYQQRLTGSDLTSKLKDGSRFIVLINDTWYISDVVTRQRDKGLWESVGLSISDLTFGTSKNITGIGPRAAKNSGLRLPTRGLVRAFGVFIPNVSDRVRIDNFVLGDSSLETRNPASNSDQCSQGGIITLPTPSSTPTEITTPTATPDADETPDESVDPDAAPAPGVTAIPTPNPTPTTVASSIPDATGTNQPNSNNVQSTPTAAPNPTLVTTLVPTSAPTSGPTSIVESTPLLHGIFCGGKSLKTVGKVTASVTVKKKLLKSIKGRSVQASRDRAIFELLINNGIRIDQLVNIVVGDYFSVGNLQLLKLSGKTKQAILVSKISRKSLDNYLLAAGLKDDSALPLFRGLYPKLDRLNLNALCAGDIAKALNARVKALKLRKALKIARYTATS